MMNKNLPMTPVSLFACGWAGPRVHIRAMARDARWSVSVCFADSAGYHWR